MLKWITVHYPLTGLRSVLNLKLRSQIISSSRNRGESINPKWQPVLSWGRSVKPQDHSRKIIQGCLPARLHDLQRCRQHSQEKTARLVRTQLLCTVTQWKGQELSCWICKCEFSHKHENSTRGGCVTYQFIKSVLEEKPFPVHPTSGSRHKKEQTAQTEPSVALQAVSVPQSERHRSLPATKHISHTIWGSREMTHFLTQMGVFWSEKYLQLASKGMLTEWKILKWNIMFF